jgi:metacaspase-1
VFVKLDVDYICMIDRKSGQTCHKQPSPAVFNDTWPVELHNSSRTFVLSPPTQCRAGIQALASDKITTSGYSLGKDYLSLIHVGASWGARKVTMTKKALCIGIDDYGNQSAPEMGMTTLNLHGCVNDAHDWANLLVRNYDFSVGDVTLLTDADATRANILKGIKSLLAGAQRGDVLVLTNSSHGFFTKDVSGDEKEDEIDCGSFTRPSGRYDEAICPYDYPKLIIDDEFRELFDGIGSGVYLTFIADACFSGSLTDGDFSKRSPQNRYNEILLTGTTDHHMSGDTKVDGRPNGFMTYHAIKVIRDAGYRLTYDRLHKNMLTDIQNGDSKYKDQNPGLEAKEEHKKLYVFTNEFKKLGDEA